eukprot:scaffold1782_cov414-Prasinococcus_capsulatus_cf.AAC.22
MLAASLSSSLALALLRPNSRAREGGLLSLLGTWSGLIRGTGPSAWLWSKPSCSRRRSQPERVPLT